MKAGTARATETETTLVAGRVVATAMRTLEVGEWRVRGDEVPAEVQYGTGCTLQGARDYESRRYDLRVTMPCDPERVAECTTTVQRWVNRRMDEIERRHREAMEAE